MGFNVTLGVRLENGNHHYVASGGELNETNDELLLRCISEGSDIEDFVLKIARTDYCIEPYIAVMTTDNGETILGVSLVNVKDFMKFTVDIPKCLEDMKSTDITLMHRDYENGTSLIFTYNHDIIVTLYSIGESGELSHILSADVTSGEFESDHLLSVPSVKFVDTPHSKMDGNFKTIINQYVIDNNLNVNKED